MVTKEQIKNSLEYKWRIRQCKTYLIIWSVMAVVALMGGAVSFGKLGSAKDGLFVFLTVTAIYSLVLLPLAIYPLVQILLLGKRAERCSVHTVKLDRPGTSHMYRGAVYYTVSFTDNGEHFVRDTKPLWSSNSIDFPLDEYNNKELKILYDRESDQVFVLGK